MELLDSIFSPADVKALPRESIEPLCGELRAVLLEHVSQTGGHLASNLGAVELTVAFHRVFDTAKDRLVFDVGHQCYVHKLLTGRMHAFERLRQTDGISGFPKPAESLHDAFIAGHASNSVSVALGMARARTLSGRDEHVIALIGDGALTGGLAYEGLCDAGQSGEPLIVILNDNAMSINANVGGMERLLSRLRVRPGYLAFKRRYRRIMSHVPGLYRVLHRVKEWIKAGLLPDNLFEDLGFEYYGPVDGHDEYQLESVLTWIRDQHKAPVLLHVITQKGKGYACAEQEPELYHGVGPFEPNLGVPNRPETGFSAAFSSALVGFAEEDRRIAGITAAMTRGSGMQAFSQAFPERFFDVGIAEGHAVSMAAGMAKQGMIPVFSVYSSFLQRSYDMLIHDLALQRLHMVLAVGRAGLVGCDGETHHGVFDVSYLCATPNMAVFCPSGERELRDMLYAALYRVEGPATVRFARGGEGAYCESHIGPVSLLQDGEDLTVVGYGTMINQILEAAQLLAVRGVSVQVLKLGLINPLDTDYILQALSKTGVLLVPEEVCDHGCVGERILAAAAAAGLRLRASRLLNLGSGVVGQGDVADLLRTYRLDAWGIACAGASLLGLDMTQTAEDAPAAPAETNRPVPEENAPAAEPVPAAEDVPEQNAPAVQQTPVGQMEERFEKATA